MENPYINIVAMANAWELLLRDCAGNLGIDLEFLLRSKQSTPAERLDCLALAQEFQWEVQRGKMSMDKGKQGREK